MSIKSLSGGELLCTLPGTYLVALSNPDTTEVFGGSAMPTPLSPIRFGGVWFVSLTLQTDGHFNDVLRIPSFWRLFTTS